VTTRRDVLRGLGLTAAALAGGAPAFAAKWPRKIWAGTAVTQRETDEWRHIFSRFNGEGIEALFVSVGDGSGTEFVFPLIKLARKYGIEIYASISQPIGRDRLRGAVADLADIPGIAGVHVEHLREEAKQSGRLTQFVNDELVPAARTRGRLITASVLAGPANAREKAGQDFTRWKLDAFFPVVGAAVSPVLLAEQIGETASAVAEPVYAMLDAAMDAKHLAAAIKAATNAGAHGVSLAPLDAIDEPRWKAYADALGREAFDVASAPPHHDCTMRGW
jgi:hypothetical protein